MTKPFWRPFSSLLVLIVYCCPALAAGLSLNLTSAETLQRRLEAGRVTPKFRQQTIHNLFAQAGCEVTEQAVTRKTANVVCTLPGTTPATIVVGGHYDFVERGEGIVDDWSGSAMLASLFETLKQSPRKHTFQFVAFTEEEHGMVGSGRYVKELGPDGKEDLRAFINLECLGLGEPKVWLNRSDPALVRRLYAISAATHIAVRPMNVDKVGDDDTHPFFNKKIPVLSLHSIDPDTLHILHTTKDRLQAVNPEYYSNAYRLAAFFLAYLDEQLP